MRNCLIYGYYDIDLDVIWSTVTEDIPSLEGKIKIIVEKLDNKN